MPCACIKAIQAWMNVEETREKGKPGVRAPKTKGSCDDSAESFHLVRREAHGSNWTPGFARRNRMAPYAGLPRLCITGMPARVRMPWARSKRTLLQIEPPNTSHGGSTG